MRPKAPKQAAFPVRRSIKLSLLPFFIAFAAASFLAAHLPEKQKSPWGAIEYLDQHQDKYSALFIGSSFVKYNINNNIFDSTMNGEARSFSIGVSAYRGPQIYYLVDEALKTGADVDYIFLDTLCLGVPRTDAHPSEEIAKRWHSVKRTFREIQLLLNENSSSFVRNRSARFLIFFYHLRSLMHTNFNPVGKGLRQSLWGSALSPENISFFEQSGGHFPFSERTANGQLQTFRDDPATWQSHLEDYISRNFEDEPAPPPGPRFADFQEIVESIRASGAEPIFVEWPTLIYRGKVRALLDNGHLREPGQKGDAPLLLSYADPRKNPRLFLLESRNGDKAHLSEDASAEFSKILAQDFSEILRRGRKP